MAIYNKPAAGQKGFSTMPSTPSIKQPPVRRSSSSPRSGFWTNLGEQSLYGLLDLGFQAGSQYISGAISERYQKRAEERADARYRQLLSDQPSLTVEARRRAGLNPYGDAVLPGMVAQSSPDTSPSDVGTSFSNMMDSRRFSFDQQLALSQLSNDTVVAQSVANKNNAEADRARGLETRDVQSFGAQMDILLENVTSEKLRNRILACDAELREYTLQNDKFMSDTELEAAQYAIDEQLSNIDLIDAAVAEKEQIVKNLQEQYLTYELQRKLMKAQIKLTNVQVQEVCKNIRLMSAQELVAKSQYKINLEEADKVKALIAQIEAETAEIPANARNLRWSRRFDMFNDTVDSALGIFGAIATGGVSTAVSQTFTSSDGSSSTTYSSKGGRLLYDSYGNPIK